jgi:hypothetical protein
MSRKFLILPLVAAVLATSAMLAPAMAQKPGEPKTNAINIQTSKSNTYKITAVNAQARTFTGVDKAGKTFTFAAPKGALPAVGKFYDIAYTASPGGGPLQATTVQSSKSNHSD